MYNASGLGLTCLIECDLKVFRDNTCTKTLHALMYLYLHIQIQRVLHSFVQLSNCSKLDFVCRNGNL